jgi:hypothetical protein
MSTDRGNLLPICVTLALGLAMIWAFTRPI